MVRPSSPEHLRPSHTCCLSATRAFLQHNPLRSARIAPPTKNGHAPPPTESRKSYRSVNPTGFQLCNHTPPGTELWFPAGYPPGHGSERQRIAGRHRLRSELRRYLIVFEPPTFALDRGKHACQKASIRFAMKRCKNFTSSVALLMAPTAPFDHCLIKVFIM
ncbi:unnamed protein product [Acanthosepion pharaonis]|uniref:Uncharacterized protein n=1 Tax=Acanthosepion pharaonis TaxID=158019 RepID=A0A812EGZ4_ACAPH|nr:unnamed protein product [Sepia pharaonis]